MQKKELELYIHIPFCVRKCYYCDFLSAPSDEETRELYTGALCDEIRVYKSLAAEYEVSSVFFGGGTPTLLKEKQFETIISAIRETFRFRSEKGGVSPSVEDSEGNLSEKLPEVEFTVECNPGTLTEELLLCLKKLGVNRLSIGLQSADNEELKLLGRIHSYEEFMESYRMARAAGFNNINVDLMQALPGQTKDSFQETLQKIIVLQPEHISAYSLIIEENTCFYEWYGEDSEKLPSEESERDIYKLTQTMLREAGYIQYEISNYAKPGYECRHNCGYWTGTEYLGLGLGASSYINEIRFEQTRNLKEYLEARDHRISRKEIQKLTKNERMEEFMFLGLRLCKGISKTEFEKRFGVNYTAVYGEVTKQLMKQGLLLEKEDRISLTETGCDLSNRVLAEFLID